jgi:hypothetical protein
MNEFKAGIMISIDGSMPKHGAIIIDTSFKKQPIENNFKKSEKTVYTDDQ